MMDYFRQFAEPFKDVWANYQGLDPDQQRILLLLAAIGVVAFIVWMMYQVHGERVVVVLPAGILRISLLLLVLPFVFIGVVTGRGTSVPGFLRESWTAEPDPDRAQIPVKAVNPMKLPGNPRKLLAAQGREAAQRHREQRSRNRRQNG